MKYILKILCAALISFIVLNLFCLMYYNVPVHYTNPDGSTDYFWDHNYFYARMTEGIGYGKTNNEGLMNEFDYEQEMNIDVLVMGSSHIENQYIPMQDNVVSLLNDMDNEKTYYNLGVSGHNFRTCVSNLVSALNKYQPEYAVLETDTLMFENDDIDAVINGDWEKISSSSNNLVIAAQHIPFIRLMASQLESFIDNGTNTKYDTAFLTDNLDVEYTNKLLDYICSIGNEYNCKIIILYHPTIMSYDRSGFIYQIPAETANSFKDLCEQSNILFLDMTERFEKEYSDNYTLPYGFINSKTAFGHLNIEGHRMMADEIYNLIKE